MGTGSKCGVQEAIGLPLSHMAHGLLIGGLPALAHLAPPCSRSYACQFSSN